MPVSSFEALLKQLLKSTQHTDSILTELKQTALAINTKYGPRNRFNRWRDSEEGQTWKQQKWLSQQKCCAICRQPIELKGSHIDHIQPISLYPQLALDICNMQITCPICNVTKGNQIG